jgi:hypothetical protein
MKALLWLLFSLCLNFANSRLGLAEHSKRA